MRRVVAALLSILVLTSLSGLAAQDAPKDITKDAQAFVEMLQKQEFAKIEALFTDQMKAALPEDKLKATWATLTMQAGAFKQQRGARMEVVGNMRRAIVTCDFERAALDLVVAYNPAGLIGGFNIRPYAPPAPPWAPPAYADVTKFTETESISNTGSWPHLTHSGNWPLPGTLTVPRGTGPFPVVVLVHGSGPNDRDESIGPNKTFKDLAFGLASRGIAVYRYDKRSKVLGAKMAAIPHLTVQDETIDDVLAVLEMLRGSPRTFDRIFVIGHSLGGMLVPRIAAADADPAAREPRIAGLVSMAGATNELPATMARQSRYLAEADGRITADEQKNLDAMDALVKTVAALTPADADNSAMVQGAPASYWLDLRGYDPPAAARSLKQPLLILQGERDYQVTMADDFAKWKTALGGKTNVTFHTYPALNHLFMPGSGKSLPPEYDTPGHVPVDVINDIAAWIASIK